MKFHEIVKLPSISQFNLRHVLPAAVLATCILVLATVSLPGRQGPLLPPPPAKMGNRSAPCDIFRGEWVPDPAAPAYTSETCPVIHAHYDCMRYGKPDLGYARWRWRPEGASCELRRLDAARFLAMMRSKSMAFVGDSLARNQMHSLVCLLARAEQPAPWTTAAAVNASDVHYHYRYERHGFAVASFWSPFLVRAVETGDDDGPGGAGMWSLHLDEPDAVWAAHIGAFDYVVVSAGSWFYRPSMFYRRGRLVGCNGCPAARNVTDLTLRYSLRMAFQTALRAATAAARRGRTVVVRTVSPSHYENGTWDGGGDCVRARPLRRGDWEADAVQAEMHRIQVEEFAAAAARGRAAGARMQLMDATEAMALRPDAHPSKYRAWPPERFKVTRDCVHWCLPGAMDACNDMLSHMLIDRLD